MYVLWLDNFRLFLKNDITGGPLFLCPLCVSGSWKAWFVCKWLPERPDSFFVGVVSRTGLFEAQGFGTLPVRSEWFKFWFQYIEFTGRP